MTLHFVAHRFGNSVSLLHEAEPITNTIEVDLHLAGGAEIEARHSKRIWFTSRYWERWYLLPRDHSGVRFETVVEAARPSTVFWLDLKGPSPRFPEQVLEDIPMDRVGFVSTKAWWHLRRFVPVPEVRTLRSAGNRWELLVLLARGYLPTGVDGAVVHSRLLGPGVIRRLKRRGLLYTWAANDPAVITELANWGVDGFIVDDLSVVSALDSTT